MEKENIIKWITQRIKDEQKKHSLLNDNWQEIAARKIYSTFNIKIKNNMMEYIKNNLTPLLIGITIGLLYHITLYYIQDTILKLAMISYGE